jgi:hypothetical protein
MTDRLIDMLKSADSVLRRDDDSRDASLARRMVARTDALRRAQARRRIGLSAAATTVAIAIVVTTWPKFVDKPQSSVVVSENAPPDMDDVQTLKAVTDELSRLRIQSEWLLFRLDRRDKRITRIRGLKESTVARTQADPRLLAALSAESAGQAMLLRADMLRENARTRSVASSAYERVIELFPSSAAASDARLKLASLDSLKGENT